MEYDDFELFEILGEESFMDEFVPDELLSEWFGESTATPESQVYPLQEGASHSNLSPEMQDALYNLRTVFEGDVARLDAESAASYMEAGFMSLLGSMAKQLLPVAISGITNAISRGVSRPSPRPSAPPPPARPSPTPRPAPPARPAAPPTTGGAAVAGAISTLLNLIRDPRVIQAVSSLARGMESNAMYVGENHTPVYGGAILNAIAEYAQLAKMEIPDEGRSDALEYLKNESGNFEVDIASGEARASRLAELLQY